MRASGPGSAGGGPQQIGGGGGWGGGGSTHAQPPRPSLTHSHNHMPRRLLDVLGTYKPVVWEYSRLNITNTGGRSGEAEGRAALVAVAWWR